MNAQASVQAYKESSVLTAPPERLVVMLYDGALRFLARAAVAMREDGPVAAAKPIQRTQAILEELLSTLDHEQGGEVAERLQAIYVFCLRALAEAQVERDAGKIDQVAGLLRELRDAWAQICSS
ncbi:MAG: flagellar export chaperone FliS [Thermoleophilaceae bacterium]